MNKELKKKLLILIIPLLLVGFITGELILRIRQGEPKTITYNKFVKEMSDGSISKVIINFKSDTFRIIDKDGKTYITDNPKYADFKKDLLENGIKIVEKHDSNIPSTVLSILPMLLLSVMLYLSYKQLNKSDNKITKQISKTPNVNFKNVAGLKEVKKDMILLVDFLKTPQKYTDLGAKLPKGVVLYGPPGTGKTLIAKAIAGEAGVPFYSTSGSQFVEMYAGVGAKRIRTLFEEARKSAPCVIFIDEIDAIGSKRTGNLGNGEQRQTINELLTQMDGFEGSEGILVICATNRIEDLDEALIRPGRFDKQMLVSLPQTPAEREEILKIYTKNKKLAEDVDLTSLAKQLTGLSPAELESLINEATLISAQYNKPAVDNECIDKALYKLVFKGHAKDKTERDLNENMLVAYHEVGHAFLARKYGVEVTKVTVIPSTSGVGGVTFMVPKESLNSVEDMRNSVKISYGGRICELLLRGKQCEVTTGASNDIQQATATIKSMITNYGMDEEIGMINLDVLGTNNDKLILDRAKEMSKELYSEAKKDIFDNKDIIDTIAKILLEKETITGEELDRIIKTGQIEPIDDKIVDINN